MLDHGSGAQREGRQPSGVDLEYGDVRLGVRPEQVRGVDPFSRRILPHGPASNGGWQHDHDALCALDHVRIGDDVAGGIDDHARPQPVLANDERRACMTAGEFGE